MRFVTFQSLNVLHTLQRGDTYRPDDYGFGPYVYALALNENTMKQLYLIAPTMPQVMLIIESEDAERYDYVGYINHLLGHTDEYIDTQSGFYEYRLTEVAPTQLVEYQIISESMCLEDIQESFQNTHFNTIERLSCNEWYRLSDIEVRDFWEREDSYPLVEKITDVIAPMFIPIRKEDVVEVLSIIESVFKVKEGEE